MREESFPFAPLATADSLHSRVTHALALQLIQAERNAHLIAFPNEGELCKQLGVSRTVVREAVKVLADKGMIDVRPRSGTRARPRSNWNRLDPDILGWMSELKPEPYFLREVCEVRLAIEPIASGFAALRGNQNEIEAIRQCLIRRIEIRAADDLAGAVNADLQYHTAVVEASHNSLFQQLNATVRAPYRVVLSNTLLLPAAVTLELDEYRKLTEAIEKRDPLAARRSAEEIVGFAMLAVEEVIRHQELDKNSADATRSSRAEPQIARPRSEH